MSDRNKDGSPRRQYPQVYERLVPVALGLIAAAVVVVLIIILAVVLGLFPGS